MPEDNKFYGVVTSITTEYHTRCECAGLRQAINIIEGVHAEKIITGKVKAIKNRKTVSVYLEQNEDN